jgi:chemotaxis protein CheY-P-specific phosphatase CheC
MNFKDLEHINTIATNNASNALSKITGSPSAINYFKVAIGNMEIFQPFINDKAIKVATVVPITRDLEGVSVLVLKLDDALILSRLFLREKPSTEGELSEMEISALNEIGNIVTGSYTTVLSNMLGKQIMTKAPIFTSGEFDNLTSEFRKFVKPASKNVAVIDVTFSIEQPTLKGKLFFILKLIDIEEDLKIKAENVKDR